MYIKTVVNALVTRQGRLALGESGFRGVCFSGFLMFSGGI